MRERRPYLYSDSTLTTRPSVTREVLSHHLETLTNQKDESTFEEFARRLCERFVAPNLRPQTGPTGGGDGKTDAETYPVAQAIASRWFVANLTAAHERWAFAFSAKKDWRAKVKSDVASIVGTQRGYPHIYFVTNQFVPARHSAAEQDALLSKHGVPVTILDRTWLLDRVFEHDSMDIAIGALGVGAGSERDFKTLGPKDLERTAKLDALEKKIADGSEYNGASYQLADDCLRAALLSRGLERPRHEIEGRFLRAIRIARDSKLPRQQLAATYDWAWTSYFWYDDFAALNLLYGEIENLALNTESAHEIERLTNLMPLLRRSVANGTLTAEEAKLGERALALTTALDRLRADASRPNNALHAQALSLLLKLAELSHLKGEKDLDSLWDEFRMVIEQSEGLGTFPFDSIADVLTEVGSFVPESAAFDRLYETMTDALAARRSEGEAAKKNSERGFQKLDKGLAYEAIRWFGRAVDLLIKAEYDDDLLQALIGSSFAYEAAGLLWASRNYALAASSHEFAAFKRTNSVDQVSPAVLSRHFWTELRLGRVPNTLSAYELGMIITGARARTEEQRAAYTRKRGDHAGGIGALLLRTSFEDLAAVAKLPDALARLGLEEVRMALLFLMGHEDTLRKEGAIPAEETPERLREFFESWHEQGDIIELPQRPDYLFADTIALRSRVLGCEIKVTCANNLISIGIGEAILGSLEALLATSLSHRILPHLDVLHLRVGPIVGAPLEPELRFVEENGMTIGIVTHVARPIHTTRDEVLTLPRWLQKAVIEIFLRFAIPADPDKWTSDVFGEENAFSRALTFSDIPTMMGIIFGDKDHLTIDEWIGEGDVKYAVERSVPWCPEKQQKKTKERKRPEFGEGEPPEGMFNLERFKHTDVQVVSPIDVRKWDAARWKATYFMMVPGGDVPPVLGLAFGVREPAVAIFEGLRGRIGPEDSNNSLRIAIIRGVWISNPSAYAVLVGPNFDNMPLTTDRMFEFVSRVNIMEPKSSRNLDAFIAEYERHRRYLLAPAHMPRTDREPKVIIDVALGKYDLVVREAWQIGENDPDCVALDPDDPPVVPMDRPNPPVLKTLKRIEGFRARRDKTRRAKS
jgi:hypothetical protein